MAAMPDCCCSSLSSVSYSRRQGEQEWIPADVFYYIPSAHLHYVYANNVTEK